MGKKSNGEMQMEKEITAIVERTDKENPKQADIAAMRRFLDTERGLATVKADEPTRATMDAFINSYSSSELTRETQRRNLKLRREELDYASESTIVRMLIDQVLLCQMRLIQFEVTHANRTNESHSFAAGIYYEKRLSFMHRRFLRAVETLAKVKRLLSETEYREQQAKHTRGQATLTSQKLLKNLTR